MSQHQLEQSHMALIERMLFQDFFVLIFGVGVNLLPDVLLEFFYEGTLGRFDVGKASEVGEKGSISEDVFSLESHL